MTLLPKCCNFVMQKIAPARLTGPGENAPLGSLNVSKDDKGREACLELTVARGLVENARRIASLLAIIQRRKTSEVALDGDVPQTPAARHLPLKARTRPALLVAPQS